MKKEDFTALGISEELAEKAAIIGLRKVLVVLWISKILLKPDGLRSI